MVVTQTWLVLSSLTKIYPILASRARIYIEHINRLPKVKRGCGSLYIGVPSIEMGANGADASDDGPAFGHHRAYRAFIH